VLTVLWITGKLDVGAIPADTASKLGVVCWCVLRTDRDDLGRANWMCALAGGCWQAFEARYVSQAFAGSFLRAVASVPQRGL
jgi:hypothetical protein